MKGKLMPEAERVKKSHPDYNSGLKDKRVYILDLTELKGAEDINEDMDFMGNYDLRSLVMARDADDVIIRRADFAADHINWLGEVGLGPGNIIQIDTSHEIEPLSHAIMKDNYILQSVKESIGGEGILIPYYYSDSAIELSHALGIKHFGVSDRESDIYNDKVLFKEICRQSGIDVVDGTVVEKGSFSHLERALRESFKEYQNNGKVFVRGNFGASGLSSYSVHDGNIAEVALKMSRSKNSDKFLVEPYLNVESSPSLLMRKVNGEYHFISPVAGQILCDEKTHQGNFYPYGISEDEIKLKSNIERNNKIIADGMSADTIEGGIDYMIIDGKEYPAEFNARMTGQAPLASLYTKMRERHGNEIYMALFNVKNPHVNTFKVLADRLNGYNGNGLLYNGENNSGVIPVINLPNGKSILAGFSDDLDRFRYIMKEATSRIDSRAHECVHNNIPYLN